MINAQSEFGSSCLIETFTAKVAMPGHPTPLDDPVKAVGVMRAEDVPRSLLRGGIRFGFFHSAFLPPPRQNVDRSRKKQILQSRRPERFHRFRASQNPPFFLPCHPVVIQGLSFFPWNLHWIMRLSGDTPSGNNSIVLAKLRRLLTEQRYSAAKLMTLYNAPLRT